ncbi:AlpA family transcriptional regulator [Escherichia coli]|nr:AlpA family transcriptional regulator [Escherichia coli]
MISTELTFSTHSFSSEASRPSLLEDQFVDMAFITNLTGLTDKWYYKLIKDGLFPKPVKLGRSSRWLKSEVEAWLQERINQSRK